MKNPLKFFFSDNFMQNHKKIFARKKDNVNFTQSTNLVNLKKKNMDMTLSGLNPTHFQGLVSGNIVLKNTAVIYPRFPSPQIPTTFLLL